MRARVGLLGAAADSHGSFLRGPAAAPPLIRQQMKCESLNGYSETGMKLAGLHKDFGDVAESDYKCTEEFHAALQDKISMITRMNLKPLTLGGSHDVTAPIVKAMAIQRDRPFSIIQFDAHPDLYEDYNGDPFSHASPFARILEAKACRKLIQVGIRAATDHNRDQATRYGVHVEEMTSLPANPKELLDRFNSVLSSGEEVYISIDLDALDPSHAPGVSHWEPGGMTMRYLLDVIQGLNNRIVGADVVEYNPVRDWCGMTAMVGAKLTREICAKIEKQA